MTVEMRESYRRLWMALMLIMIAFMVFIYYQGHHAQTPCLHGTINTTSNAQVFLMGTIGGDYNDPGRDCWRENTIQPVLHELGVSYYNPVVENWSEENAREEAEAIENAETIVLVITENHASIGSLAESGWAVLSALERDQIVILYIADTQDNIDSQRARQIVLSQVTTLAPELDFLIHVDSLDDVIATLQDLYGED